MNAFKQITIADRQSIIDIAMQEYGCYEGVFAILEDNADRIMAIDEVPLPGMKLNIRNIMPEFNSSNRAIVSEYKRLSHNVIGNGNGTPYIAEVVSGYVAVDYIAPSYISAPQGILTLQNIANINLSTSINIGHNHG